MNKKDEQTTPTEPRISLIIADDHPVVRKGLRDVIASDPGLLILGEADNGTDAWEAIRTHTPHVAVLDLSMPGMSGLEVAEEVNKWNLTTAVVILTVYDDEEICSKAIESGVRGYILKDCTTIDILRCIHRVAEGDYYISPALTRSVVNGNPSRDALTAQHPDLQQLTPVERRVLHLIAMNKSTKEIADELSISPRTVDRHRYNLAGKLNLHGSFALLRFALENSRRL
jgi:DNA-binding NarL/FixJ family response regulator